MLLDYFSLFCGVVIVMSGLDILRAEMFQGSDPDNILYNTTELFHVEYSIRATNSTFYLFAYKWAIYSTSLALQSVLNYEIP